MTKHSRTICQC